MTLLAIVTLLDRVTGPELSFSIFYLLPVSLAVLGFGLRSGAALSGIAAVLWYIVDRTSGAVYSHPLLPVWNGLVRLGFFLTVTVLLNELRLQLRNEEKLARRDPVSGLFNRAGFTEAASREVARSSRLGAPLAFAYIDVDDFKQINDRFGHATGDAVLRAIGSSCSATLRTVDIAARLGGDEFALCLPDTGAANVEAAVRRLRGHLDEATAGLGLSVGLSVGVVAFELAPVTLEAALREVDAAMYRAKQEAGKDSTTVVRVATSAG